MVFQHSPTGLDRRRGDFRFRLTFGLPAGWALPRTKLEYKV
jgi:hypothetical protein